jgi:acetyl esterase
MALYPHAVRAYIPSMPSRSTPAAARARIAKSDFTIDAPGHAPLAARRHGTRRAGAATPVVLHFHGGAFTEGDLDSGECMANLMAEAGAVVVSLAYPLAPAHPFPGAIEAAYAALEWTHRQRNKLGGAGARVFVAGDEAGGNLAAAVAMVARDRDHPPLAGQILIAPMLDPCVGTASLRETMACEASCKWADGWQSYLRGPRDAEHPYAVPGRATRLADLPAALVLAGADDPMRDEAMAYAQRLRAAGIAVTSGVLPVETGWPESLTEPPAECPCATRVREHLRAFFYPATPPPH